MASFPAISKNEYKKCDKKVYDSIIIQIKDNKISNIIDGLGWIHPTRKKQYIALINNVLLKYKFVRSSKKRMF